MGKLETNISLRLTCYHCCKINRILANLIVATKNNTICTIIRVSKKDIQYTLLFKQLFIGIPLKHAK